MLYLQAVVRRPLPCVRATALRVVRHGRVRSARRPDLGLGEGRPAADHPARARGRPSARRGSDRIGSTATRTRRAHRARARPQPGCARRRRRPVCGWNSRIDLPRGPTAREQPFLVTRRAWRRSVEDDPRLSWHERPARDDRSGDDPPGNPSFPKRTRSTQGTEQGGRACPQARGEELGAAIPSGRRSRLPRSAHLEHGGRDRRAARDGDDPGLRFPRRAHAGAGRLLHRPVDAPKPKPKPKPKKPPVTTPPDNSGPPSTTPPNSAPPDTTPPDSAPPDTTPPDTTPPDTTGAGGAEAGPAVLASVAAASELPVDGSKSGSSGEPSGPPSGPPTQPPPTPDTGNPNPPGSDDGKGSGHGPRGDCPGRDDGSPGRHDSGDGRGHGDQDGHGHGNDRGGGNDDHGKGTGHGHGR